MITAKARLPGCKGAYETYCCNCGKLFRTYSLAVHFCSKECSQAFRENLYGEHHCCHCGKSFWIDSHYSLSRRTCSIECRRNRSKVRKVPAIPLKRKTFDDYIREAYECGLSYGKYKAQLHLGKTYEELKELKEKSNVQDF